MEEIDFGVYDRGAKKGCPEIYFSGTEKGSQIVWDDSCVGISSLLPCSTKGHSRISEEIESFLPRDLTPLLGKDCGVQDAQ